MMLNLLETVHHHCPEIDAALVAQHCRCLPATYWERYAPADIARHLRLLARLSGGQLVELEIRPLASQAFEVLVVGIEQPGRLACITAALAAHGFDPEDVQVASYQDSGLEGPDAGERRYFVMVLRVSGRLGGESVADLTAALRERLCLAFAHLAQGNLVGAQAVAAYKRATRIHDSHATECRRPAPTGRLGSYEGLVLGNDFRLQQKLATGGMSEVYLAAQQSLNRTVAVKLFLHEGKAPDELLARFNREALVLAQFSCPHIVPILAAGTAPEHAAGRLSWMAMEYMAGGDLASWLQRHGPLPAELATRWLRQALEGLQYAHQRSIIHRDLKPHNLLLTAEGHLKVSDFGLLKQAGPPAQTLTPQATLLGTPHYMSPEQALGEALDERSDIFSLGTTFFHLLSGRLPFDKTSATALLIQIAQDEAPCLTEMVPDVPLPLAVLVRRMMARRREARYQSLGVVLDDLASYECRGLLKGSEAASPVPAHASPSPLDRGPETQAYHPLASDA